MDERFRTVKIPRGVYIYLKGLFKCFMKQAIDKEFPDEYIGDCEIATAIYGLIMEHENRGGQMEQASAQIDWWNWHGESND